MDGFSEHLLARSPAVSARTGFQLVGLSPGPAVSWPRRRTLRAGSSELKWWLSWTGFGWSQLARRAASSMSASLFSVSVRRYAGPGGWPVPSWHITDSGGFGCWFGAWRVASGVYGGLDVPVPLWASLLIVEYLGLNGTILRGQCFLWSDWSSRLAMWVPSSRLEFNSPWWR